jgi:hypothetical protein
VIRVRKPHHDSAGHGMLTYAAAIDETGRAITQDILEYPRGSG